MRMNGLHSRLNSADVLAQNTDGGHRAAAHVGDVQALSRPRRGTAQPCDLDDGLI
jgi:hypothetical protein